LENRGGGGGRKEKKRRGKKHLPQQDINPWTVQSIA